MKRLLRWVATKIVVLLFLRLRVFLRGAFVRARFRRDANRVEALQWSILRKILRFHAGTEYGRRHGFAAIQNVSDYRTLVPVNTYEDLRPWFEQQERDGSLAITAEAPVLYTLTSGTTGKPKFLPVLKATLAANKKIQNFFLLHLFRERPKLADGKILTIVSAAIEGYTENAKIPFGATTGHMYAQAPRVAHWKYVVPAEIFAIADYDLRFRAILRLALQEENITYLTTANPTTFLRLIDLLNSEWDLLLREVREGSFTGAERLEPRARAALEARLRAEPLRAERLEAIRRLRPRGRMRYQDVWLNIQAVGTWTGGSCAIFVERLRPEFAPQTLIRDVGYHSSEFRGSSPIFAETNAGVPSFREHFFEFVEREAWDQGLDNFLGLTALEIGKEYYVFITTQSGLYRYDMNDIVRVDGFYKQVPLISFQQKGKGVTSITGEKLYENQVIAAVKSAEASLKLESAFYLMVANAIEAKYYLFYEAVETSNARLGRDKDDFIARIEAALSEQNLEYAAKRESGRLQRLELASLRSGTYEAYKRFCIARGQRESQFKIIALNYSKDVQFDFTPHTISQEMLNGHTHLQLVREEGVRVS